jgi:hypothetical protein
MPDTVKWKWRLPFTIGAMCLAATAALWTAQTAQQQVERSSQAYPMRNVTEQEAALLHKAEQLLIKQCMGQRGFKYWIVEENPVPEFREFPYVLDDVSWARRHGYGTDLERRMQELSSSHPNKQHVTRLPLQQRQAWLAAIHGQHSDEQLKATLPTGGVIRRSARSCISDAEQQLYGDVRTWYRVKKVTVSLKSLQRDSTVSDARFIAAVSRWALCLRDKGYRYLNPTEVRAELHNPEQRKSRAEWVQLAVTEATCADRTGLAAIARQLDRHYAQKLRDEYPTETLTTLRLELAAVPSARAIVGSS